MTSIKKNSPPVIGRGWQKSVGDIKEKKRETDRDLAAKARAVGKAQASVGDRSSGVSNKDAIARRMQSLKSESFKSPAADAIGKVAEGANNVGRAVGKLFGANVKGHKVAGTTSSDRERKLQEMKRNMEKSSFIKR